jgi:hypothetical protein
MSNKEEKFLMIGTGVSKLVILITCNPGTDGSFYGDAMTMLIEQVTEGERTYH